MKLSAKVRIAAVVLLGVVAGIGQHFYEAKELRLGRDAFLAAQGVRYDRLVGLHHPIGAPIVAGILIAGAVLGLYELVAFALTKLFTNTTGDRRANGS